MALGSLDGGDNVDHSRFGFVKISKLLVTQDAIFFGPETLDSCYYPIY